MSIALTAKLQLVPWQNCWQRNAKVQGQTILATATKSTGLSVAGKLDKVQPTPAYFLARSVTLTFDLLDPNSQPHWGASLHYITVFSAGPTTTRTGPAIQVYCVSNPIFQLKYFFVRKDKQKLR